MTKEWIQQLADDIKRKDHDAAEKLAREEHRRQTLTLKGEQFYDGLIRAITDDVAELNAALAGDITASPIAVNEVGERTHKVHRARFPMVQAQLRYELERIALNYSRSGSQSSSRSASYDFQVSEADSLSIRKNAGDKPGSFESPEDLARHLVELLFAV